MASVGGMVGRFSLWLLSSRAQNYVMKKNFDIVARLHVLADDETSARKLFREHLDKAIVTVEATDGWPGDITPYVTGHLVLSGAGKSRLSDVVHKLVDAARSGNELGIGEFWNDLDAFLDYRINKLTPDGPPKESEGLH